jgi:hypothetical protein
MVRRWRIWRSVLAGVIIGFAEGTRLPAHRRSARPLGVVWLDDRRQSDPLLDLPLLLLDPVPLERDRGGARRGRGERGLRLELWSPIRWLRRVSGDWTSAPGTGQRRNAGGSGRPGQRWQRGQ